MRIGKYDVQTNEIKAVYSGNIISFNEHEIVMPNHKITLNSNKYIFRELPKEKI